MSTCTSEVRKVMKEGEERVYVLTLSEAELNALVLELRLVDENDVMKRTSKTPEEAREVERHAFNVFNALLGVHS